MEKNFTINRKYIAGVVFNSLIGYASSSLPPSFSYTLRFRSTSKNIWETNRRYPKMVFSRLGPNPLSASIYNMSYFLWLQHTVDNAVLKWSGANNNASLNVLLQRMPFPKYWNDLFNVAVISQSLGSMLYLSFLILAANVVSSIVTEKEKRLKVRNLRKVTFHVTFYIWRCTNRFSIGPLSQSSHKVAISWLRTWKARLYAVYKSYKDRTN